MQNYLRDKVRRRKGSTAYSKRKLPPPKSDNLKNESNNKINDAIKNSRVGLQLCILLVCLLVIYLVFTKLGLN